MPCHYHALHRALALEPFTRVHAAVLRPPCAEWPPGSGPAQQCCGPYEQAHPHIPRTGPPPCSLPASCVPSRRNKPPLALSPQQAPSRPLTATSPLSPSRRNKPPLASCSRLSPLVCTLPPVPFLLSRLSSQNPCLQNLLANALSTRQPCAIRAASSIPQHPLSCSILYPAASFILQHPLSCSILYPAASFILQQPSIVRYPIRCYGR
jgi:hypothetical protein